MAKKRSKKISKKQQRSIWSVLLTLVLLVCFVLYKQMTEKENPSVYTPPSYATVAEIPAFSGQPYVLLNNDIPSFTEDEIKTVGYEEYGELDSLGRCTYTYAYVGIETMPKENEERESISNVKPSGWAQTKYEIVDGAYLYNRCHLIGWQLTAGNDNEENLITGTRYLNIEGMLEFENTVAEYVRETNNHVMYRVTPIYDGNNLLCSGVQMEAYSVEDGGKGIEFNVYCYNVQPGILIDYATGESRLAE